MAHLKFTNSTQKTEASESLNLRLTQSTSRFTVQPEIHSETLIQKRQQMVAEEMAQCLRGRAILVEDLQFCFHSHISAPLHFLGIQQLLISEVTGHTHSKNI